MAGALAWLIGTRAGRWTAFLLTVAAGLLWAFYRGATFGRARITAQIAESNAEGLRNAILETEKVSRMDYDDRLRLVRRFLRDAK